MKKLYVTTILSFLIVLQLYIPASLNAQCLCAGAIPATPMVQTITIPPTTVSTLAFNFQQFNPAVGTLSCVSFADTVTGYSYTGARNTGPDSTAFLFMLSLTSKIQGPGILISHPFTTQYGYDTLAPYGQAGDTITYGPANIITNPIGSGSTGGNAAYLGTGTVPFMYGINGGMITLDGGSNYKTSVTTTIGGTMSLTYYYCPLSLLATNMQNFTAKKKDNGVMLNWDAQNAGDISKYDIEYSTDGINFVSVAKLAASRNAAGSYSYNYMLSGNNTDAVYFRIEQISENGKTGYSAVQKVMLNEKTTTGISIHPNPAVTGLSLTFDHLLTGDYSVDLINTAGQVVLNKKVRLANNNSIPVSWTNKPSPGIYFTRVTNTGTMEQQIIRVVIK